MTVAAPAFPCSLGLHDAFEAGLAFRDGADAEAPTPVIRLRPSVVVCEAGATLSARSPISLGP